MKFGRYISKLVYGLSIFSILMPLVTLLIWSFVRRWTYPSLLPTGYSIQSMQSLLVGIGCPMCILCSSILLALLVGVIATIVGMMTARAIVLYDFSGKRWLELLTMLPLLVPTTAFAMGMHIWFIRLRLSDRYIGVLIVHVICALPYTVKIMTELFLAVNTKYEEQAQVFGVTQKKAFFYTTLPMSVPGILASISMGYIISLSQYFLTLLIGGGSVLTFTTVMVPLIQNGDRTLSSVYSSVFILSSLIVFGLVEYATNQFIKHKKIYLFQ